MPKRSGRKSKAQTPAPKAERIYGSEKNPKGTAASGKSASKIKLSKKTIDTLKNKLDDFKNKYPTKKNVSLDDLKAVYRRGSGAYSKSHRPTISGGAPNSRAAWSYARVNKFLQKAAGLKVKKAYIQDDDLLKRGGEIDPKAFDLVFYHEKKGNWVFAKNMIYVWLYDDLEAGKKLQSGEYDWVVFPPTAGISAAFRKGYVPPIKAVWTKKFQKDRKGSDKLVGIVEAYYDEQENKLYILMMTTRKDYQRRGVNSYLIKFLREQFKLEKDQVVFDKPTEEGKKFEASGKFEEGGKIGNLAPNGKPSNLTPEQYKLVRTPAFKSWFGDWENEPANASKVVDENGEPKVMWHGSNLMDEINVFQSSKGFDYNFFSENKNESARYVTDYERAFPNEKSNREKRNEYYGKKIKPFFINARNIFEYDKFSVDEKHITDKFLQENQDELNEVILKQIKDMGTTLKFYLEDLDLEENMSRIDLLKYFLSFSSDDWWILESKPFQKFIIENKYDSFVTHESGAWNIAVYNPRNIKLANGNNTTFDSSNPDIRFEEGGDLLAANEKPINNLSEFLEWVIGFNKSVIGKLNVFISVPTELTPFHEYKNTVFLDLFEKIDQDIDAKPYLRQILAKADEYGISIIIEPKPRYKYFENNIEKKNKIDVKYLKEYYSKFGFKPIDEKYMIRKPDQRFEEGGSIQPIETLISKGILELKTFDTKPEHALAYGLKSKNPLYFQTIYVLKEHRLNGIGNMALQHIDEYAIKNGHDLIFGHIAESSEPSVDVVKSILEKAGYSLCENNNDFYKYYQAANLLEDDKTLYHGSPYSFDSFSENNIGTGEGNMKYGRGFYFTESREVAERYSLVPSDNSFYINGVQLKDSSLSNDEKAIILAIWREKWEEGYSETKEDYISEILYELEKRSIFDAEAMEGIFSQTELQTLYAQTDIYKKLYDYLSNSYIEIKSYIYEIKPDSNLKLYFTDEEVTDINEKFDGLIYDYPYTNSIKNYVLFSPESFSILSKKEFSKGGNIMKVIECVNCGWKWNSNQSDESDLYVCHQCGFDNTLFYETVNILKPTLTIEQIAKKHNVHEGYIENQLDKGKEHELEHTNNEKVAEKIALHHLAETPDYYEKLETLNLEDGAEIMVDIEPIEYLNLQKKEAEEVLMCSDTKIFKAMICKSKIEMAEKNMDATENPLEKNVWNECVIIWKNCMNNIVKNNIPKMKEGGQPCGCGKIYSKGGLAYGNSHDKGGMPMVVKSTGQNIEIEGGEGVINKRSMQMTKKVEFEGKRMTPCEVISKINQMGGGVKFKCEDVKEIIDADGQF